MDLRNRNSNSRIIIFKNWIQKKYFHKENTTGNVYQKIKQEITLILHRLFQNIKKNDSPTHFNDANITLIVKPDTDSTKNENNRLIPLVTLN